MKHFLFALAALLLLAIPHAPAGAAAMDSFANRLEVPPVTSDDPAVNKAMNALYEAEGDPQKELPAAIAAVQKMAEAGNAEAAFRLGRYYDTEALRPNYEQAVKFYQLAAAKGHGFAMANLGILYERGNGVKADTDKAIELYKASVEAGDHHGYLNMARVYFEGVGEQVNVDAGMEWLRRGAEKKNRGVLTDAASIYHNGVFGIPENRRVALEYLQKALDAGDLEAGSRLANAWLLGDCSPQEGLAARVKGSDNCILQSPRKGITLLEELAAKSSPDALRSLGRVYWYGVSTDRDVKRAVDYWEQAAALGDCKSFVHLSEAYGGGNGVGKNEAKELDYLKKAVACNPRDADTLYELGKRYYAGTGVQKDCVQAEKYLRRALSNGERKAFTDLGFIYDRGCEPIAADKKVAFGIYLTGAKLGIPLCQNNVGALLKHGWGVEKDLVKAYAWLQIASANGSNMAKKNLMEFDAVFKPQDKTQGVQYVHQVRKMLQAARLDAEVAFDGIF